MARYRRLQAVVSVGRDIDELFDRFFGPGSTDSIWQPLVDVFTSGDRIHILAEIPGIEADDIRVTVGPNTVELRGRKRVPEGIRRGASFYEAEIPYGEFEKRIALPFPVEPNRFKIKLENGVLRLQLDRARSRIREIAIE